MGRGALAAFCLCASVLPLLLAASDAAAQKTMQNTKLPYPQTRKGDQTDDYFGTKVADPYRWLEDANSPETKAWIEAENRLTFGYLSSIPGRADIQNRLTALWNYERFGVPFKEGGRYFYTRNSGLQNQGVLYVTDALDATPRVLLDPNRLSKDGTIALSGTAVSHDGKYLAYSLSSGGSDWQEWHIREVETGNDLPDRIEWSKFSGASWTADNRGFYYGRYPVPEKGKALQEANYFNKLYYHRVGTPQEQDTLVYERPDEKEWEFAGNVTDDGHYLIISVFQGTEPKNRVFYKDLTQPDAKVVELLPTPDARYRFLDSDGPVFWFQTDKDAPRSRVIAIDTRQPEPSRWREVIPQAAENLEGVSVVGDRFFASYLKDAHTQIKVFALDGNLEREIALPGLGTAGGFPGKRRDTETFYDYTSYTVPRTVYRCDIASGTSTIFRQPKLPFRSEDYETRQVFYASKDGTRIPMFLTYRKGLKHDGNNPTLLYGYGGFRIPEVPYFSPVLATWLEMGGVYATPNLRGGGEYGVEWHEAGRKEKKQNVFDDFIAAAEWLVSEKITAPHRLAIEGGSNGGLLVGAVMTQRPDLFGAALPAVGVMDMLRFQKFTIGWAWVNEFGSSDDAAQFRTLYAYSPLHNLRPGTAYPATLITTGDHDDRVVPAHSFKFAATLQAAQAGTAPALIRIETRAGHGAGKPTTKIIAEATDRLAFLTRTLGMTVPAAFGR
jgi:prolyl oligopeptidase